MLVNIKNEIKVYFERKANLVLECEIEEYLKEHKVSRNGYYTRFLETKYERLRLKVPRLRQKGFCPSLFYPYQRQDKDFSNILESICSSCKSIQEKQEIISSNYGLFYSKTFIKNFSNKVQEKLVQEQSRELKEKFVCVFLDSTFLKVNGSPICLSIALGLKNDHTKQILDFAICKSENLETYKKMLENLKAKGLKTSLFVSDQFRGLEEMLYFLFPCVPYQKCFTHFYRNLAKWNTPLANRISTIVKSNSPLLQSEQEMKKLYEEEKQFFQIYRLDPASLLRLLSFKRLEPTFWKTCYTNNPIENLNCHLKRQLFSRRLYYKSLSSLSSHLSLFFFQYERRQNSFN